MGDEQVVPGLVTQPLEHRGRADDVAEQQRDHDGVVIVGRPGEHARARPLVGDVRHVTDDPSVVTRRDLVSVALHEIHRRSVGQHDVQRAFDDHAHVAVQAPLGADDGLDVGRPPPAGLELPAAHLAFAERDAVDVAVREFPHGLGLVEALALKLLQAVPIGCWVKDPRGAV